MLVCWSYVDVKGIEYGMVVTGSIWILISCTPISIDTYADSGY
jgi:hypothetical protein